MLRGNFCYGYCNKHVPLSPHSIPQVAVDAQRELLSLAADLVRPGGLLVYATCSIEAGENEGQVEAFLRERKDYR